jgi:hypothetical protein
MPDGPLTRAELELELRDLATVSLELSHEHLALAERHALHHDALERVADRLHAEERDVIPDVLLGLGEDR